MKNGPSLSFMHMASEVHKIAVMLDNRGPSGTWIYTQKGSLQLVERQSLNDSAKDSLLKLMKTVYDMANIFWHFSVLHGKHVCHFSPI